MHKHVLRELFSRLIFTEKLHSKQVELAGKLRSKLAAGEPKKADWGLI